MFQIQKDDPDIDPILDSFQNELGSDFEGYRNHVYRVFNMAVILAAATGNAMRKIAITSAFHDMGIWSDGTWDYIQPSIKRAARYLADHKKKDWIFEVSLMISEHHKLSSCKGAAFGTETHLANAFRSADWLDVMLFMLPSRIPRTYLKDLLEVFPRAGFHKRLFEMGYAWAKQHPTRPLPMFKF